MTADSRFCQLRLLTSVLSIAIHGQVALAFEGGPSTLAFPPQPSKIAPDPDFEAVRQTMESLVNEIEKRMFDDNSVYRKNTRSTNPDFEHQVVRRAIVQSLYYFRGEEKILTKALDQVRSQFDWKFIDIPRIQAELPGIRADYNNWLIEKIFRPYDGNPKFSIDLPLPDAFLIRTDAGIHPSIINVDQNDLQVLKEIQSFIVRGYSEPVVIASDAVRNTMFSPAEQSLAMQISRGIELPDSMLRNRIRQAIFINVPRLHADKNLLSEVIDNLRADFPGIERFRAELIEDLPSITQSYINWMNRTVIPAVRRQESNESKGQSPVRPSAQVAPGAVVELPSAFSILNDPENVPTQTYSDPLTLQMVVAQLNRERVANR